MLLSPTMLRMKLYSAVLIIFVISFSVNTAFAQARNSIGIGAGLNFPVKDGYQIGRDRVLQANIFARKRFAIMPTLGWETFRNRNRTNIDMAFLNIAAKLYLSKSWFVYGGPSGCLSGHDGGVIGWGGSVGGGYEWAFDKYSSVEFSLRTDFPPAYLRIPTAAGLRVAYKFNFSKKDIGKYRVPEDDERMN